MFVVKQIPKREEFNRRFQGGFQAAMDTYNRTLDNSFAEYRVWGEPFPETVQASGNILPAGFVRPTKDLGDLMNARVSSFVTPLEMHVAYPIHYADDVFNGFISLAGNYIPGRPLPQIVPNEIDWGDSFLEGWNATR
jgi:hypothetical protein